MESNAEQAIDLERTAFTDIKTEQGLQHNKQEMITDQINRKQEIASHGDDSTSKDSKIQSAEIDEDLNVKSEQECGSVKSEDYDTDSTIIVGDIEIKIEPNFVTDEQTDGCDDSDVASRNHGIDREEEADLIQSEQVTKLQNDGTNMVLSKVKRGRCKLSDRNLKGLKRKCKSLTSRGDVISNKTKARVSLKGKTKDKITVKVGKKLHFAGKQKSICPHCGESFEKAGECKQHMKTEHTADVGKPFTCSECQKAFSRVGDLQNHMKIHGKEKPFQCRFCDKAFPVARNLGRHVKLSHPDHYGGRNFLCKICEKHFILWEELDQHMRLHNGLKDYVCEECGSRYLTKSDLRQHEKTHEPQRPHKCDYCSKEFIRPVDLKRHVRMHTGEKPYKCSQCDKGFTRPRHLKFHMEIHEGKRPDRFNRVNVTSVEDLYREVFEGMVAGIISIKELKINPLTADAESTHSKNLDRKTMETLVSKAGFPKFQIGDKASKEDKVLHESLSTNDEVTGAQLNSHDQQTKKIDIRNLNSDVDGTKQKFATKQAIPPGLMKKYLSLQVQGGSKNTSLDDAQGLKSAASDPVTSDCDETKIRSDQMTSDQEELSTNQNHSGQSDAEEEKSDEEEEENAIKESGDRVKLNSSEKIQVISGSGKRQPTLCTICGQSFVKIQRHLITHSGTRPHSCLICGKAFITLKNLKDHINVHLGRKPYDCPKCNKSFYRATDRQTHLKTHDEARARPFECSECSKLFLRDSHLKRHLKIHTGLREFKCSLCNKAYLHADNYELHMKCTHMGIKDHICPTCGKAFARKGDLMYHERTHNGGFGKRFPCNICEKTFPHSGSLTRHLRMHTGERPFNCNMCGKTFSQSGHWKEHVETHKTDRPYNCSLCGKAFKRKCDLKQHHKTHSKFSKKQMTNFRAHAYMFNHDDPINDSDASVVDEEDPSSSAVGIYNPSEHRLQDEPSSCVQGNYGSFVQGSYSSIEQKLQTDPLSAQGTYVPSEQDFQAIVSNFYAPFQPEFPTLRLCGNSSTSVEATRPAAT